MAAKEDRRYLESHEWHKLDGDVVSIGISRFAVDELTDITYLELSQDSGEIAAGQAIGEIESVKTTSELYSGIYGEIVAVNTAAIESPEILNDDPWDQGWIIKIKPSDPAQLENLLSAADYDAKCNG